MFALLRKMETVILWNILHITLFVFVDGTSIIYTDTYECSRSCVKRSSNTILRTFEATSRLQCAAECCKYTWCNAYIFLREDSKTTSSKKETSKRCQLYFAGSFICSDASSSSSDVPPCMKTIQAGTSSSSASPIITQRVLEVSGYKPYFPMGRVYLENALEDANNIKVLFTIGTSTYFVSANVVTLGTGINAVICTSIWDSMQSSINLDNFIIVRSFCADGSQPGDRSYIDTPDQFFWNVEMPQKDSIFSRNKVYATGGDPTTLVSALTNGFDMKLVFIRNRKCVRGDVIIHKNTGVIEAQTRLYDSMQLQIVSHLTSGLTENVIWSSISYTLSDPISENTDTIWFSDSCWRLVYNRAPATFGQSVTNLMNSIESGRRIRVRVVVGDNTILATPDYVAITVSSGTVTAYVLRVLIRKQSTPSGGVLGIVNNLLGSGQSGKTQLQWSHYMITHSGAVTTYTTDIGAQEYTESSSTTTVQWFEDTQNWSLIHTSDATNTTTLSRLVAKVLNGSDVRIKFSESGVKSWFSCDMVKVIDKGRDVKCQVTGKVSLGNYASNSNGLLAGLLSSSPTSTKVIVSECFAVYAWLGSTDPSSSCLWHGIKTQTNTAKPERVEWFVPT